MLLEFSVENYLSFKELVTFSMLTASTVKEHQEHTFPLKNKTLLRTSAIYGANGSGKSNLIKAMKFMKNFVHSSSKDSQAGDKIDVERFRLSSETDDKPCFFEIIFMYHEIKYRYGFTADQNRIHNEWLYQTEKTKEAELFIRNEDGISIGSKFKEAEVLKTIVRDNALFLSVTAQFNIKKSLLVLEWFNKNFIVITTEMIGSKLASTLDIKFKNSIEEKKFINKFIRIADLGIDDIFVEKVKVSEKLLPKGIDESLKKLLLANEDIRISTLHNKYDSKKNIVSKEIFDLEKHESDGTRKFLGLSTYIMDAILNGNVLIIDEIDSRIHSMMIRTLVEFFNSSDINSQLVFSTHDVNLLDKDIFRRDQIWFVEKDIYGASTIYSLVEYKVRNDASYKKNYIQGRYGAIPILGDFNSFLSNPDETR